MAKGAQRPLRNAPEGRLHANQPAKRCRDTNGTAGICPDMQRPETSRPRRPGAGRRTARRALGVPGIARDAMQRAVARRFPAKFRGGGLADDHRARLLQPNYSGGVFSRLCRICAAAAAPGGEARQVQQILHRRRHTIQHAHGPACLPARLCLARCLQGARVHGGKGVDPGIVARDAFHHRLQRLHRG